jgi:hypothetical protein
MNRDVTIPTSWAGMDAYTGKVSASVARMEAAPYRDDSGTVGVLVELMTPTGYSTAVLPVEAARLIARAILAVADEARDDWQHDARRYREGFGMS